MKRLKDLNFKKFSPNDLIANSARLSLEDFMASKEPGRGASNRFIDLSGHQIINAIGSVLPVATERSTQVYVYKDHYSHPGYVSKKSDYDTHSELLTDALSITDMCFDRVIAVMDVIPGTPEFRQRIAVKYESDGFIDAVMGLEVKICENFNIFGGSDFRISTSKRKGVDFDFFMHTIKSWIAKAEEKFQLDIGLIRELANTRISTIDTHELIGGLMTSYHRNQAEPVLNLTEISKLAAECVKTEPESLWDFTNNGTLQVRFESGDSEFDRIIRFNEYVLNYMHTNVPVVLTQSTPVAQIAEAEFVDIS